jgi:hypothetical protein
MNKESNNSGWYKKAIAVQVEPIERKSSLELKYPYYIAQHREGRMKGQYPPDIAYMPQYKRMWDQGKMGNGTTMKEYKADTIEALLADLQRKNVKPQFDNVDFFIVEDPNRPRQRIAFSRLIEMQRRQRLEALEEDNDPPDEDIDYDFQEISS